MLSSVRYRFWGLTDKGRGRASSEEVFFVLAPSCARLSVVLSVLPRSHPFRNGTGTMVAARWGSSSCLPRSGRAAAGQDVWTPCRLSSRSGATRPSASNIHLRFVKRAESCPPMVGARSLRPLRGRHELFVGVFSRPRVSLGSTLGTAVRCGPLRPRRFASRGGHDVERSARAARRARPFRPDSYGVKDEK